MSKRSGVTINVTPPWGGAQDVEARNLCTIHRAVLPGHPTDFFVVELDGGALKPSLYPEAHIFTGGRLVHAIPDFETLVNFLGALGMRMCHDEENRGAGKELPVVVDMNEAPPKTSINRVSIRDGFTVTVLEAASDEVVEGLKAAIEATGAPQSEPGSGDVPAKAEGEGECSPSEPGGGEESAGGDGGGAGHGDTEPKTGGEA